VLVLERGFGKTVVDRHSRGKVETNVMIDKISYGAGRS
jgi:hypothetical protein